MVVPFPPVPKRKQESISAPSSSPLGRRSPNRSSARLTEASQLANKLQALVRTRPFAAAVVEKLVDRLLLNRWPNV